MKISQQDGVTDEQLKQKKYNTMYMDMARTVASMSYCERKKVGAILERDGRVISMGWNGTRSGEDNTCEGEDGLTLPGVAHAEENCLKKLITSNDTSVGATMYITAAPCQRCAEKLVDAKVKLVYYAEIYGGHVTGLEYLKKHKVEVEELPLKQ